MKSAKDGSYPGEMATRMPINIVILGETVLLDHPRQFTAPI